jgi:integrase
MASIDRYKGCYRARWRTPDGESRSKVFARKLDAQRHLTKVEHDKQTGSYVDSVDGVVTFEAYAIEWMSRQVWRDATAANSTYQLARVYPKIGKTSIGKLRSSDLQALVRYLADEGLAPSTIQGTMRTVASVLGAAVIDRAIATNPAAGVKLPRVDKPKVRPLELHQVLALADAVPERLRGAVLFASGSGLRMGEVRGLTVDRVDFLRRTVTVDRQMVDTAKGPTFGPPKTKASHRTVALAPVTLEALAAHLAEFKPGPDGLVFTNDRGQPWKRNALGGVIARARSTAGLPDGTTFHDLRHHFASVLIGAGCSIKAVQDALGHANASETLDTYSHLWPADEDRIRDAVQALHGGSGVTLVSRAGG